MKSYSKHSTTDGKRKWREALTRIQDYNARLRVLTDQVQKTRSNYVTLTQRIDDLEESHRILRGIAMSIQNQTHKRIASIVSKCLSGVFDEPYALKILFEEKRGKTEARIVFERDGLEVDPMSAAGGGVVDVASFALRLACLFLSRPAPRRIMVLDEPFRFVSKEYRERIGAVLEMLSEELDFQFVMVTHFDELHLGNVVHL